MKNFLLVVFLLKNFSAYSQKRIDGQFGTPPGYVTIQRFTFNRDGTFEYVESGCTHSLEGKGDYTFKKDLLKLHFRDFKQTGGTFGIKDEICKLNDSVEINFLVMDYSTRLRFHSANIYLKSPKGEIVKAKTDLNGLATIKLLKQTSESEIVVSSPDYKEIVLKVIVDQCKKIYLSLKPSGPTIPSGTIWKYTYSEFFDKESKNNGIKLKNISDPDDGETILYERKTEELD